MPVMERQAQEYLHETLGVSVSIGAWADADRLPVFLTGRYRFAQTDLMGRTLVLMIDESPEQESPAVIRKHIGHVQERSRSPVVYVRDQVTAYNRKRLIEQRVQFIIPGNQLYLPELGLDLREYFRTPPASKRKFRPATQALFIFMLLEREDREATAAGLAPVLGYSTMTLSRAFDELESIELAETDTIGRERVLRFVTPHKETWERAQQWLIDPVRARHHVTFGGQDHEGLQAGQDALARYTMLAEPRLPVTAVSQRKWKQLTDGEMNATKEDREFASTEIEVWKYEPREYRRPGVVDPLSLYLSLRRDGNERVEQALEQLMEQVQW